MDEFLRALKSNFIARGYFFYVQGEIPAHKDPARTDAKIIAQYELDISKWKRARLRRQGRAAVHYLRWQRFFVIVATHGQHEFFAAERAVIRDIRRHPILIEGRDIGAGRKGPGETRNSR